MDAAAVCRDQMPPGRASASMDSRSSVKKDNDGITRRDLIATNAGNRFATLEPFDRSPQLGDALAFSIFALDRLAQDLVS